MIQDIGEHKFLNSYQAKSANNESLLVLCTEAELCVCEEEAGSFTLPRVGEFSFDRASLRFLFTLDDTDVFLAPELSAEELEHLLAGATRSFSLRDMRWLRRARPAEYVHVGAVGLQLACWYRDTRFCSRCGAELVHASNARELCCPECAQVVYPKISPGVIVGVIDRASERMVVTSYAERHLSHYALVAGFTEIGETLEQCVKREVQEELGISVTNIRYYKNQPWPFSSSLLVGFFCELEGSSTLQVDGVELESAQWVVKDDPALIREDRVSLTAEMMRVFASRGVAVLDEEQKGVTL